MMNNVPRLNGLDDRPHLSELGHRTRSDRAFTVKLRSVAAVRVRHALLLTSLGVFASFAALPNARAEGQVPTIKPAINDDAGLAVSQMDKTLSAPELSFTARTVRVYLDEFGEPLHIFHTMKVVMRRPDRLKIEVNGDDGSHDLFYDGKSVAIFSPDSKVYGVIAAPGGIASAANAVLDKLNLDFPLVNFFAVSTDQALLRDVVAGWQVGTANIDGIECRHLLFHERGGADLELWVENNEAAIPHRLIVTYRLLPGQPSFMAEFTNWDNRAHPSDNAFVFQAPSDVKQIELAPVTASAQQGRE
jgi:hypothetical protein